MAHFSFTSNITQTFCLRKVALFFEIEKKKLAKLNLSWLMT